ncbi:Protein prune [Choanephora cucurbitarum]|uniref:Protein prune n=1 Tax=Choanephora cucurbitarum TaxID=101091 RepID=A0A1C7NJF1_9FUNG|nr:Protein prune [Choanephora cucurbitarum]
MLTFSDFLKTVHQKKDHNDIQKVIVTGNDSAGILLIAHDKQLIHQDDSETLYIPFVKVPRADLALRPELKYVFEQISLDEQLLVCLDDIDLDKLAHESTKLVLVDHNHLTSPLDTPLWHDRVVGVLDHHVDEKMYLNAPLRVVEMVGSCVTLVLNQFPQDHWIIHRSLVQLALAPLLIDTVQLKWDLGRTTQKDMDLFELIQQHYSNTINFDDYFKAIERVKARVDGMPSYDILRRDYKEFHVKGHRIGTSAVTWYFDAWADRDGSSKSIEEAAMKFVQERGLAMEIVFTAFDHDKEGTGDYRRQLAVMCLDTKMEAVKEALVQTEAVQLKPIDHLQTNRLTFYDQGNIKMSRKQVWPLVRELIESKL